MIVVSGSGTPGSFKLSTDKGQLFIMAITSYINILREEESSTYIMLAMATIQYMADPYYRSEFVTKWRQNKNRKELRYNIMVANSNRH